MKKILLTIAALIFVGCEAETKVVTDSYVLPTELSDCKVYLMYPNNNNKASTITVVRCPLSNTSTIYSGKHSQYTTVVEVPVDTVKEKILQLEFQLKQLKEVAGVKE